MQDVQTAISKALTATRQYAGEIADGPLDAPGSVNSFFLAYLLCSLDPDGGSAICDQLRALRQEEVQREYQRTVRTTPSGLVIA